MSWFGFYYSDKHQNQNQFWDESLHFILQLTVHHEGKMWWDRSLKCPAVLFSKKTESGAGTISYSYRKVGGHLAWLFLSLGFNQCSTWYPSLRTIHPLSSILSFSSLLFKTSVMFCHQLQNQPVFFGKDMLVHSWSQDSSHNRGTLFIVPVLDLFEFATYHRIFSLFWTIYLFIWFFLYFFKW